MTGLRLFYAEEGRTELGDWADLPQYRHSQPEGGVLQALVSRVTTELTVVVGARVWKDIPTLRPGGKRSYEQRRVGQLSLFAKEAGADVVVFSRDRDGDQDREMSIEDGIAEAGPFPKLVGGVAAQAIEAWVLALRGETKSESYRSPKSVLEARHNLSTTQQKVADTLSADLQAIPEDAVTLHRWLKRAREHLL